MKKRIEDLVVVSNRRLNREFFVLKLASSAGISDIFPGQFAEVRIDGSPSTFLRRPFSFYDVDFKKSTVDLLIKFAGSGTEQLSKIKPGEKINLIYPLGNSFSTPNGSRVLLTGGGTGVAPLLFLGKYLLEKHAVKPQFLFGFRTSDLIVEIDRFEALGKVDITTEDGSFGYKGLVTHHPVISNELSKFTMIYACGPEAMIKEVSKFARISHVNCEVSLENLMGCGFGACLCCVVDTIDKGNVNTCTEGPVFNTKNLKWLNLK
jgi:dihydroorotate dehydrogenase electron transfer subunit